MTDFAGVVLRPGQRWTQTWTQQGATEQFEQFEQVSGGGNAKWKFVERR